MSPEQGPYRFGSFLLDPARRRLEREGREVPLQPKVFSTLLYLVERSDRVVPREEFLDALWSGTFVTDNVLSRSIREVRRALGDEAGDPAFVKTVPRVGYHFVGEIDGPAPGAASPRGVRTLAVLPFRPLVPRAGDESLEMGMADTLITRLSNLPDLVVRPLSAVRAYTGFDQDPLAAGRRQRADAVVEGGIQRQEARVRVTVRVLRVADGSALMAEAFDEPFTGIFGVQDAICRRIADALALKLSGREARRLEKRHTKSTEAYRLYLLGRLHLGRRTGEGARASLD